MRRRTKVVLGILLICTLIAIVFFVTTLRTASPVAEESRQITASLYGYRVDGRLILQDRTGYLWEIPYTEEIHENDNVLLDVTGRQVNHVYVEVFIAGPETEN